MRSLHVDMYGERRSLSGTTSYLQGTIQPLRLLIWESWIDQEEHNVQRITKQRYLLSSVHLKSIAVSC